MGFHENLNTGYITSVPKHSSLMGKIIPTDDEGNHYFKNQAEEAIWKGNIEATNETKKCVMENLNNKIREMKLA